MISHLIGDYVYIIISVSETTSFNENKWCTNNVTDKTFGYTLRCKDSKIQFDNLPKNCVGL